MFDEILLVGLIIFKIIKAKNKTKQDANKNKITNLNECVPIQATETKMTLIVSTALSEQSRILQPPTCDCQTLPSLHRLGCSQTHSSKIWHQNSSGMPACLYCTNPSCFWIPARHQATSCISSDSPASSSTQKGWCWIWKGPIGGVWKLPLQLHLVSLRTTLAEIHIPNSCRTSSSPPCTSPPSCCIRAASPAIPYTWCDLKSPSRIHAAQEWTWRVPRGERSSCAWLLCWENWSSSSWAESIHGCCRMPSGWLCTNLPFWYIPVFAPTNPGICGDCWCAAKNRLAPLLLVAMQV